MVRWDRNIVKSTYLGRRYDRINIYDLVIVPMELLNTTT